MSLTCHAMTCMASAAAIGYIHTLNKKLEKARQEGDTALAATFEKEIHEVLCMCVVN
eukprot:m.60979 g.60979  ORF g.60979 m.60979 type:complete len:57 (-) comp11843_c0_seq5:67-237(-)